MHFIRISIPASFFLPPGLVLASLYHIFSVSLCQFIDIIWFDLPYIRNYLGYHSKRALQNHSKCFVIGSVCLLEHNLAEQSSVCSNCSHHSLLHQQLLQNYENNFCLNQYWKTDMGKSFHAQNTKAMALAKHTHTLLVSCFESLHVCWKWARNTSAFSDKS